MDITIKYLNDHPEFIDTIARWHYDQWHHILHDFTLDRYTEYLSSHYRRGGIPSLFVAVHKSKVIGTAAFEDYDMDTHQELSPWLASVYVDQNYRKKGVGRTLVRRVIEEARSFIVNKLYLFTSDRVPFYTKYGWAILFREEYYGEMESVMVLDISPQIPSR
jgi:GNAT superfamily N-acetyltransferase